MAQMSHENKLTRRALKTMLGKAGTVHAIDISSKPATLDISRLSLVPFLKCFGHPLDEVFVEGMVVSFLQIELR